MPESIKVGLVLSGGGAKGAYQVGVLKALLEMGTRVDVVAGASIGALNAAVLASAPSLETGVERLDELWLTLAKSSPLSVKIPGYLSLLVSAGLKMNGFAQLEALFRAARLVAQRAGLQLPEELNQLDAGALCDKPLKELMEQYLDPVALNKGLPLYVSVFKSLGGTTDLLRTITAELGILGTAESEFLHIQSLSQAEQKEALLASAGIPLLFAPRQVNDSLYSDGGQGGWQKQQGNTPITPLLQAGCNMVIVTHLSNGSLWSRHDFPEATILEIRPQSSIARDSGFLGGVKDLLGFDPHKIPSWIEQGYQDTLHCVGRVMKASASRSELRKSENELKDSERRNTISDSILADAMSKMT
ncbi:patatin-like phospholipase family protein [Pseudomonas sp. SA3-5]|uniref:Patatin-like phospholipase family protein n=1 Tax=Pseudomonas aestuarii TaxID=3018340 RepID=A0ABT4XLT1_9PSED|nr:patatin-like phospholipase family protein [Pseudomonas aestuarii]MDA7089068.1 patatin-like phospholipase family protein [Pseudomonas aestuarii]